MTKLPSSPSIGRGRSGTQPNGASLRSAVAATTRTPQAGSEVRTHIASAQSASRQPHARSEMPMYWNLPAMTVLITVAAASSTALAQSGSVGHMPKGWLDVTAFGAVGDGVFDDESAITE